jgi:hypothetical protein
VQQTNIYRQWVIRICRVFLRTVHKHQALHSSLVHRLLNHIISFSLVSCLRPICSLGLFFSLYFGPFSLYCGRSIFIFLKVLLIFVMRAPIIRFLFLLIQCGPLFILYPALFLFHFCLFNLFSFTSTLLYFIYLVFLYHC